ncbi:hypothetical protein [Mycolicibacterium conceptionense]|nr:hypothetical protein [Mycolicibacterium conceptionense]
MIRETIIPIAWLWLAMAIAGVAVHGLYASEPVTATSVPVVEQIR